MANRTTLKTYFETGDKPTQAQFGSLIDSDFNKTDDTSDDLTEGSTKLLLTSTERSAIVTNTAKRSYPSADESKLSGIEAGATGDQTASEIKTAYESNSDTNAYTNTEKSKLSGIESGAEVNDANTTLQGNTFNGVSQLVQTDESGKLPAIDGSQLTGLSSSGESNTASNVGTAGVGVFKQKSTYDLEFKKINAGSSKVTITDDTGDNEIDIDIVESNIGLDNIADGTTYKKVTSAEKTVLGNTSNTNSGDEVVASSAEINTGTDNEKMVTPDGLAGSNIGIKTIEVVAIERTTDVAIADGVFDFIVPSELNGMNLIYFNIYVITAGTTNATTCDLYNVTDSTTMLSSYASIASGDTAGTAGTVDTAHDDVATGDHLRGDVQAISTTAPKGLIAIFKFQLP